MANDSDRAADKSPESAGEQPQSKGSKSKKKTSTNKKKGAAARKKSTKMAKPVQPKGSSTRNVVIFLVLVLGLAAAFALLGNQTGGGDEVTSPKWKVGEAAEVTITVVTPDYKNLACAMEEEVAGRHCAFQTEGKVFADKEQDSRKNDKLLQPYTTVNPRMQFLASGLWTSQALKDKLAKEDFDRPSPRFNVQCKFNVEGKSKGAKIRWKTGEGWNAAPSWYVGNLTDCVIK